MKRILSLLLVLALSVMATAAGDGDDKKSADKPADAWSVDAAHSSVTFTIKHFFTPVAGSFDKFDAEITFDPEDLAGSSINVTIDVNSINTSNEKRNKHLKSGDFFNAKEFPSITFASESIESLGDGQFVAKGNLTMRDVTKAYDLPFTLLGIQELPEQMRRDGKSHVAGFSSETSLNRNDYGVGTGDWAATLVIGDEVNIAINIESYK